MLASWRSVTEQEYPQYFHLIPHPDEIYLSKIDNGGVMTDTCNSAQKANWLIASSVNGVIYSTFFRDHLRNVWVKNVIESLTEFLRAHLNYSIDKVSTELLFSPRFMSRACAFEK